jgi:A/G-specific adenine glycosylase
VSQADGDEVVTRSKPARQGPEENADWIEAVRRELLAWYDRSGRQLPWRESLDAYRILVSEMMLVQTTVAAVAPFFRRFVDRFPDPQSLASAGEDEVLKAWEGLGYYRRARHLHAAVRVIVDKHGGEVPRHRAFLQELPGVGRYIAGAVLSFAYNLPEPILEANSQRVLARLHALRQDVQATSSQQWLWKAAERLVPSQEAGRFNHALMDLGALVCTPRSPACLVCPLASLCAARRLGLQDVLPVIARKPPPLAVTEACALVQSRDCLLVLQRKEGGLWSNFWEFPTVNLDGADPAGRSFGQRVDLAEGIARLTGIKVELGPEIKNLTYTVTKHRVSLRVHRARAISGEIQPGPGFRDARWASRSMLADLPLGSAARRLVNWINQEPGRLETA